MARQHNTPHSKKIQELNLQELVKAYFELNSFCYRSIHDLKGPVASVTGLCNLAAQTEDAAEIRKFLMMIKTSMDKLSKNISSQLEVLSLKNTDLTIEKINIEKTVEDVLNGIRLIDGFSEINFKFNVLSKKLFYSDIKSIRSVFQNLIENAIKYRNPVAGNSYIHIKIQERKRGVHILVEDNGIGIEKKFLKKIFDSFFRATDLSKGSGLGLYIVRQTVEKLGGKIHVDSKPGSGTKFSIYLPAMKAV